MYGKCGGMYDARHVFDNMLHRVSVSWNSVTAGYSENGFTSQGLEVFSQMHDLSLQPNEFTLASILANSLLDYIFFLYSSCLPSFQKIKNQ